MEMHLCAEVFEASKKKLRELCLRIPRRRDSR
jgi:hypothetical protein